MCIAHSTPFKNEQAENLEGEQAEMRKGHRPDDSAPHGYVHVLPLFDDATASGMSLNTCGAVGTRGD